MNTRHEDILKAVIVDADENVVDVWLDSYSWTTGRGRRIARRWLEDRMEARASRVYPGWKRISWNVIRSTLG